MIESPHNEKLKLVRKLRERKQREREGAFVSEGEDLVEAGLGGGRRASLRAHRCRQRPRRRGGRARAAGRGLRALARGRGQSRSGRRAGPSPAARPVSICMASAIPATSARSSAPRTRCSTARSCSGPAAPTPSRRRRCGRAWARSSASRSREGTVAETPAPRVALVAHGGEGLVALDGAATLCLGAEREGLPEEVLAACDSRVTIPLRAGGAESLNVAAVAAICAERISSPAMPEVAEDA